MRFVALAGIVVAVDGCRTRESDLELPVYSHSVVSGVCGGITALDGQGGLWSEHGCESSSGFQFVRTLTEEERAQIVDAFAAHPDPGSFGDPNCDGGYRAAYHRFTERLANGSKAEWDLCVEEPAPENGDAGLQPPFVDTASAFSLAARR